MNHSWILIKNTRPNRNKKNSLMKPSGGGSATNGRALDFSSIHKSFLCVPAASASSEHAIFSADHTVTKERNRLTGEDVEAINFLYINENLQ